MEAPWPLIFGIAVWTLWRTRNHFIFRKELAHRPDTVLSIISYATLVAKELSSDVPVFIEEGCQDIHVSWRHPPANIVKLNVDGLYGSSTGLAACGGLFRDANGCFLQGFKCSLGVCNAIWAELWGLLVGLRIARQRGYLAVIVEMDSKAVVHMINMHFYENSFLQSILHDIIRFIDMPHWTIHVDHIYREANRAADFLANQGHDSSFDVTTLDSFPPAMGLILFEDMYGCGLTRTIG